MRAFLIAALCACLAYAKPQYNYPAPSTPSGSYGSPSVSYSSGSLGISGRQSGAGGGYSQGTGSFQSGTDSFQSGTGSFQSGTSFSQTEGSSIGGGIAAGGFSSGEQSFSGSRGIPGRQVLAGGASSIGGGGGGTLVQKHIYVHVAPPEPEEARPHRPISVGQATKHYKIIFIKAPSYQTYQQQILQHQAQNEEKTLVYVLVKKPDDQDDITIPTAAPTAPSKPEVYFIKYKAKSEVTGGGASGSQLSGGGAGIGGTASLSLSSASSASSQFNAASSLSLSTGDSSSSVSVARPQTNYGPPGQSGPY